MDKPIIPRSVGVHDGTFHADEVTACALLSLCNLIDRDKIVRSRDLDLLSQCEYVCDVGGVYDPKRKLFDHHQAEYKGELSSAGMILQFVRDTKCLSAAEYHFLNESLIRGVDAHDNGRAAQEPGVCSFSHVIANFTPFSYEASDQEQNKAFFEAFDFAYGHLSRLTQRFRYNAQCQEIVKKAMQRYKTCLFFNKPIPWLESFFALDGQNHSACFVIMPAGMHWKLRAIPPDLGRRMQVRVPLPGEWAGLLDDDLKTVSGIPGAIFCHKGRFTSVWETREDAIKALHVVLEKNGIADEDIV